MKLTAKLLPIWTPELGAAGMPYSDRFNVTVAGEIIVERSRDPETDLARALLERGHHGKVTLVHGETGKPRTIIDIEKTAKVRTVETGTYPRFRRIETCAESPPAAETQVVGMDALTDKVLVWRLTQTGNFEQWIRKENRRFGCRSMSRTLSPILPI
jgi:hypothetical protein